MTIGDWIAIANSVLILVIAITGSIYAWGQRRGMNETVDKTLAEKANDLESKIGGVVERLEEDLSKHIVNPVPHSACPTHSAILQEIRAVLSLIQERISSVDDRMFTRMGELERRLFEVIKNGREGGLA